MARTQKWQSIDTAPESPCFVGKHVGQGFVWDWVERVGGCWINHHGSEFVDPTHWHPPLAAPGRMECRNCGGKIEGGRNSTRQFCSSNCAEVWRYGTRECRTCGVLFGATKPGQNYCSVSCGARAPETTARKLSTREGNLQAAWEACKKITDAALQRELAELLESLKR